MVPRWLRQSDLVARVEAVERDVSAIRGEVSHLSSEIGSLSTEISGLKDLVTTQMVKLEGGFEAAVSRGVTKGIEDYQAKTWETRLSDHLREVRITLRYWGRRAIAAAVAAAIPGLWTLAGPRAWTIIQHWMGWTP